MSQQGPSEGYWLKFFAICLVAFISYLLFTIITNSVNNDVIREGLKSGYIQKVENVGGKSTVIWVKPSDCK